MKTNNIELQIVVNDKVIAEYKKDSAIFVEAKAGYEYGIRVKNHNTFKCKVVIGIDGINIVDSKPLGDNPNEMGYILDSNQDTLIKGYRVNTKDVASFKFVEGKQAYANKSKGMAGKTQGVISAKVYVEKVNPIDYESELAKIKKQLEGKADKTSWPYIPSNPWYPRYDDYWYPKYPHTPWITWCGTATNAACSSSQTMLLNSSSQSANYCHTIQNDNAVLQSNTVCSTSYVQQEEVKNPFSLGSTFGKKVEQEIREVAFEVGDLLTELAIYYTNKAGLVALGVEMKKLPAISKMPQAFPASKTKYCEVPSGWDGV